MCCVYEPEVPRVRSAKLSFIVNYWDSKCSTIGEVWTETSDEFWPPRDQRRNRKVHFSMGYPPCILMKSKARCRCALTQVKFVLWWLTACEICVLFKYNVRYGNGYWEPFHILITDALISFMWELCYLVKQVTLYH